MTPAPDSGRLDGGSHLLPIRVYYEDTDAGGIVYHANYLRYAERARSDFLRLLGLSQLDMKERLGLGFVVRRLQADYLRSARLDDALQVVTRVRHLKGASVCMQQEIRDHERLLVGLVVDLALLSFATGRAVRFPADLRAPLLNQLDLPPSEQDSAWKA